MRKRLVVVGLILAAIAGTLTSCGSNPVVQETSQGVILEDKAKDAVDKMGGQAQDADEKLDSIGDQ